MPEGVGDIIELSDAREYYDHVDAQASDPTQWGLFRDSSYNFVVQRPLNFVVQQQLQRGTRNRGLEGVVRIVDHQATDTEEGSDEEDDSAMLFFTAASASLCDPLEAIEIEGKTLLPAIICSYTNVDFASGYSGFKSWIVADPGQSPEDTFFIPGTTPNTANPVNGELSRLREHAPDLGALCTRQMLAVPNRLRSIALVDRVQV